MNRKVLSLAAITAAATAVVAVVPNASAATATAPTPTVITNQSAAPADVVRSIVDAPAFANTAASALPVTLGSFVVVTNEAVQSGAAAAKGETAAADAPAPVVELPVVPNVVTDILNTAGLPVRAVYRVIQTSQGVYSVWYKMLSTVPNAILKGEFGAVPTLFRNAVSDSLAWIATGEGPLAPKPTTDTATAARSTVLTTSADALSLPTVPSVVTSSLNVVGIPVATAYAGMVAAQSVYSNFYGLLSSVPRAVLEGKFGDAVNLVVTAVNKSITTIVEFPSTQFDTARVKVNQLLTDLKALVPIGPTVATSDKTFAATTDADVLKASADAGATAAKASAAALSTAAPTTAASATTADLVTTAAPVAPVASTTTEQAPASRTVTDAASSTDGKANAGAAPTAEPAPVIAGNSAPDTSPSAATAVTAASESTTDSTATDAAGLAPATAAETAPSDGAKASKGSNAPKGSEAPGTDDTSSSSSGTKDKTSE